jgi:hypothetical protein
MSATAPAPTVYSAADETVVIRLKPTRDRAALLVAATATVLSIAVVTYYARQHLLLGVWDAYSHIEISREVVAGPSPGIAQLGGVWLPLPHMLQALFAWNWTLYSTGLAGSLVSMASYIASSTLIYKITRVLTGKRSWPAVAGALVFMVSPNVLYLQSTSMDELPFYAFTLGTVYALMRWASTRRATYVLTASITSMFAMLCRYEAWFLGVIYVACVVLMARKLGYTWRDTRGLGLVSALFGLASAAIGWMIYNWLIFDSPINFLNGPNSSQAIMTKSQTEPELGNWPLALRAYGIAVQSDVGFLIVGAALFGLVLLLVRERLSTKSLPVLALILVIPFMMYSLESGQEPIGVPQINGDLLNLRYGLIVILPAAILIGYLLGLLPRIAVTPAAVAVMVALTGICANTFYHHQVVLAAEAIQDHVAMRPQATIGSFLADDTKGPVLIDRVGNERLTFPVLDRTVYSGTRDSQGSVWTRALKNPEATGIDVIVMRITPGDADAVYTALNGTPMLRQYREIYHTADYEIYVLG